MIVNILSSEVFITTSTRKGVKSYEIHGNEFGGVAEEVSLSGQTTRRAKIGRPWTIGKTSDRKKAKDYVRSLRSMGNIISIDLPESAKII
jgi:hypothetical protein